MIRNDQKGDPASNFQKTSGLPSGIYKLMDSLRKKANPNNESNQSNEIRRSRIIEWKGVKWTDIAMVLITAILAWGTWKLYREATNQSKISKTSADAAFIAALQAVESNRIADSNFKLAASGFQAEIDAFKQEQQRFLTMNTPIIDVASEIIKKPTESQPIVIDIHYRNFGGYAVKIISSHCWTALSHIKLTCDSVHFRNKESPEIDNSIIKGNGGDAAFGIDDTLSKTDLAYLENGYYSFYVLVYIKYQNIITGDKIEYKCIMEIAKQFDGYYPTCSTSKKGQMMEYKKP